MAPRYAKGKRSGSLQVLVDFDGTIAPDDPTDQLFERFAGAEWRDIEVAWQSGAISSRQCMARQVALLRTTPELLDREIRKVRIDPAFVPFLEFCRRRGADVKVVSDGFERVVSAVLRRAKISVPIFANNLTWQGDDRWHLSFPHLKSDCRIDSANCKCAHTRWSPFQAHVVIGDGRSDFCMAARADYVIAKGSLAAHCRLRGLPYATFADFKDVIAHLSAWLASRRRSLLAGSGALAAR
jgi:2-hydroxy-3-keto-5-methylthiopentenyl-1-phosphate phosphatase